MNFELSELEKTGETTYFAGEIIFENGETATYTLISELDTNTDSINNTYMIVDNMTRLETSQLIALLENNGK